MSCCLQLLGECGVTLLWRSRKRNVAPLKAQGRSLALSDNCSQWSPTCKTCWSNKIWQGWNCFEVYCLALELLSFSSWRRKRVFTDEMEDIAFPKEGCHCNFLLLLHRHKDWWMSWAPWSPWKQLTAPWRWQGLRDADSAWKSWKVVVSSYYTDCVSLINL